MNKKGFILWVIFIYLISVALSFGFMVKGVERTGSFGINLTGEKIGTLCMATVYPAMKIDDDGTENNNLNVQESNKFVDDQDRHDGEKKDYRKRTKTAKGKPRVLIYHTHATESYLPSSSGNYHTTEEENTVREAGEVLKESLEDEGIAVVHDKTLHDNPSYNDSYTRSFSTLSALLKKYPSIECVIDLHRDATPAKVDGPVWQVGSRKCAVYSYVVSNGVSTYEKNKNFLVKLNKIAGNNFGGYTGEILERPYEYNQELLGKSILIEIGNNRNNIKEARNCAYIFGKILAKGLGD